MTPARRGSPTTTPASRRRSRRTRPDAARLRRRRGPRAARSARRCSSRARRSPTASSNALSDAFAVGARRARRHARRSRRAAAAELPAVLHRRARRLEDRRDRRAAQPDLHRARARGRRCASNGIETIVTLTRFYERVKRVQPRTPLTRVIATNIKEYFPPLLRAAVHARPREAGRRSRRRSRRATTASRRCSRAHRGRRRRAPPLTPDDPAVLLMSGGTTGTPKGVLGHARRVRDDRPADPGLDAVGPRRRRQRHPAAAAAVPRLRATSACRRWRSSRGNPIALVPNPRDLPDLLATIRRVKPAFFNGVPTLYIALLNHPDVQRGKVDFKSIKICFSGAAALMADTKQRFEAMTGGRIVEGYSLTEAMMALCVNPVNGPNKIGSVGMPLPDVHVAHLRRRRGHARDADRRGRRDLLRRAAADDRLLEPARGNRRRAPRSRRRRRRRAAGCTPATSAISTTTATCSSSIARRT